MKEKVNKTQINRMRNGYNIDTITSVDIQEIVKNGGKSLKLTKVLFIVKLLKNLFLKKYLIKHLNFGKSKKMKRMMLCNYSLN